MQYNQIHKPIKWLVLHREEKKELYELESENAVACNNETISKLGFYPKGQEYWLFKIKKRIEDENVQISILSQVKEFNISPQIIIVT